MPSSAAFLRDTRSPRQQREDIPARNFILPAAWVTSWAMDWRELMKKPRVSMEPQVGRKARKGMKEHVRKGHKV